MKKYKFICDECGKETTSNYCDIGDKVHCKNCSKLVTIPNNATLVCDSDSSVIVNANQGNSTFTNVEYSEGLKTESITIFILKGFAIIDLIIGIIFALFIYFKCGIMIAPDYERFDFLTLTIIISFVLQGIFAYALCNALALIVENLLKINIALNKKS